MNLKTELIWDHKILIKSLVSVKLKANSDWTLHLEEIKVNVFRALIRVGFNLTRCFKNF